MLTFFELRVIFLIQGVIMLGMILLLAWLPARLGKSRIRLGAEGSLPTPARVPPATAAEQST